MNKEDKQYILIGFMMFLFFIILVLLVLTS